MLDKSHIDINKLEKVPTGQSFEYKDIVKEDLPIDEHTLDGKRFKDEVENGVYDKVKISKQTGSHLLYKKL